MNDNNKNEIESALEQKLICSYKEEMISFLKNNPEYFEEAILLAIGDKQPFSWRAAFLLWSCIEENDSRIRKHISKILKSIPGKKDGHQRELIKILSVMKLSDAAEGKLFDICMNLWEQNDKDSSVRVTAFKFIIKMAEKYPELREELKMITGDHYLEALSPGIRKSVNTMMHKLK